MLNFLSFFKTDTGTEVPTMLSKSATSNPSSSGSFVLASSSVGVASSVGLFWSKTGSDFKAAGSGESERRWKRCAKGDESSAKKRRFFAGLSSKPVESMSCDVEGEDGDGGFVIIQPQPPRREKKEVDATGDALAEAGPSGTWA